MPRLRKTKGRDSDHSIPRLSLRPPSLTSRAAFTVGRVIDPSRPLFVRYEQVRLVHCRLWTRRRWSFPLFQAGMRTRKFYISGIVYK
jgi:hypothetical protein